jgi:hypothetical protein
MNKTEIIYLHTKTNTWLNFSIENNNGVKYYFDSLEDAKRALNDFLTNGNERFLDFVFDFRPYISGSVVYFDGKKSIPIV